MEQIHTDQVGQEILHLQGQTILVVVEAVLEQHLRVELMVEVVVQVQQVKELEELVVEAQVDLVMQQVHMTEMVLLEL